MKGKRYYRRFTIPLLLEHWIIALCFAVLALTGLPQMFSNSGWAKGLVNLLGGIEQVRFVHHLFALIMILSAIYHILAWAYRTVVLCVPFAMLPRPQDIQDLIGVLKYNLGLSEERPRFGRYSYEQKLEYWAMVWGSLIMIGTGFMLWRPVLVTHLFPGAAIPTARVIHGGEALLAVLAIMTWHAYHVHLRGFNRSIFTGKLSEEEMEEEHPLELEQFRAGKPAPTARGSTWRKQAIFIPLASLIAAILLFGVGRLVRF
jgi:formate dehydrogenase gamma subunit